ncbi:LPS export ABC transporter periplasmic protein LptC [Roseomonas sp. NAR14]|uniref:LPS export ABC transporter periplasmic protein LptC n=1 Tax=Roseomonas acroporae TaxID=2937791 RepID=A0A9X1Y7T1_9PROT|nr:LPS export ABC transporter periplasmic protein LptC [Roseomonas acroporae]MCK8784690.1 LPS export ABC transporter periplasmic protein LptC [Roseomonas acroporae]
MTQADLTREVPVRRGAVPAARHADDDPTLPLPERMPDASRMADAFVTPAAAGGRARDVLGPARQRVVPTRRQMLRRRVLVRGFKWLLPVFAVLLLAAVALWPEIDSAEDRGRVAFRRVLQVRPDGMRVVSPRYQGIDEQNRPFTVTAAVAVQPPGDDNIMDLERPRADILMGSGAWVLIEARHGRYDKARQHLDLWGEVTIFQDDGTQMVTERAEAELAEGSARGDAPVAAQGPFGTLTAEGFVLTDRGAKVVFTGRAHAVLEGGS